MGLVNLRACSPQTTIIIIISSNTYRSSRNSKCSTIIINIIINFIVISILIIINLPFKFWSGHDLVERVDTLTIYKLYMFSRNSTAHEC